MVLSKLRESGGKGVPVLKMLHEVGELTPFYAVMTGVELVTGGGEGI